MLMDGQAEKIIIALVKIMRAVEEHKHEIVTDRNDLRTDHAAGSGSRRTLDSMLVQWNLDPVGQALREGVRGLGELFIPLATSSEVSVIIDRVAEQSPDPDRAHAIMNSMFDGLTTSNGIEFFA